ATCIGTVECVWWLLSIFCLMSCIYFCFVCVMLISCLFFFFNDTATTEIYTLSLHDALPIFSTCGPDLYGQATKGTRHADQRTLRSEEHTSELQSPCNLVCRLLLEKKNNQTPNTLRGQKNP